MADARAQLDVRHVILPWAQQENRPDAALQAQHQVAQEAHDLRVHDDKLSIQHQAHQEGRPGRFARGRQRLLAPPLRAVGLPYEPHPSVPREDRRPMQEAGLVSVAVALDVIATLTRKLAGERTVLSELAVVLLHVGRLGGIDLPAVERLLEHAQSLAGRNRAMLSRRLALCMQEANETESVAEPTAVRPTTPRGVAEALRRIETAASRAVAEARLRLEAQEAVEYKQA